MRADTPVVLGGFVRVMKRFNEAIFLKEEGESVLENGSEEINGFYDNSVEILKSIAINPFAFSLPF